MGQKIESILSTIEYKGKVYLALELTNFNTIDGYHIDYGVFVEESFEDVDDDTLEYRMLDNGVYGYLPKDVIMKSSQEIREFIKQNIG